MTLNKKIMTCLTIFLLASCKKDDIELSILDYLIFGHFYSECQGENCIEIFKLEEDKLFEDLVDKYPNSKDFYDGNYFQLSDEQFNDTEDILDSFPTDLLSETNTVIGQPDAGDWGGIYIEYNLSGVRKFWLLDKKKSNVPTIYHTFIDKVNEKITLLQ